MEARSEELAEALSSGDPERVAQACEEIAETYQQVWRDVLVMKCAHEALCCCQGTAAWLPCNPLAACPTLELCTALSWSCTQHMDRNCVPGPICRSSA